MAVKKGRRRKQSKSVIQEIEQQPPVESRFVFFISLATLLLVLFSDFLVPRMTGDTFMMLAGGRDVFDGKLGQPDEWAFTTEGRVWINQNWGTSVLFYVAWKLAGYNGIVIIKGVAIALMGLFLVLAAKQLKATTSVAMLVASFILLAAVQYIDMRANTVGLTFLTVLMCLLYWSYDRPHRIWVVLALIVLWTHMHGSFIFGIAVLGLWTLIVCALPLVMGATMDSVKRLWPLPAATVLALVLAVVTSPFGLTNLQLPFSYIGLFQKEEWPSPASEMFPLFDTKLRVGLFGLKGTLWYLFTLGWLAAPLILRIVERVAGSPRQNEKADPAFKTKWLFTLILAAITIIMAFRSRRFVPISLIGFAPLMAYETQRLFNRQRLAWLCGPVIIMAGLFGTLLNAMAPYLSEWSLQKTASREQVDPRLIWSATGLALALSPVLGMLVYKFGRRVAGKILEGSFASRFAWFSDRKRLGWAPLLLAVGILYLIAKQLPNQIYIHDPNYPGSPRYDAFGRMVNMRAFPEHAVQFMAENNITGRVLNEWRWEGFLQWYHPEAKVMLGGRSRTVYSPRAAKMYSLAKATKDYSIHKKMGISLIIAGARIGEPDKTAARLLFDDKTPWRIIYYDGTAVIAANRNLPQSKQYIIDASEGRLTYPTTQSEKCTLAARRVALSSVATPEEIIEPCRAANAEFPVMSLYYALLHRVQIRRMDLKTAYSYLLSEAVRLADLNCHRPRGLSLMNCRLYLAQQIANFYSKLKPPRQERVDFWKQNAKQVAEAARALMVPEPGRAIDPIPERFRTL